MSAQTGTTVHSVTVTRTVEAPPDAVWRAWTIPECFARWFFTPPFETPVETVAMDVRPGGEWRATQVNEADGARLPFVGHYREVAEPGRLVMTFENPEDLSDPNVEIVTVTFSDADDGATKLTLRQEGHLPPEQYELLGEGYSRFFDNLARYLAEGERNLA
ncbi:MAG TPA: SRPBCC domain-containing protein [Coriobacteriia bacterium]|jgi:uncharacterized protein YndB with AHSA1/START domain